MNPIAWRRTIRLGLTAALLLGGCAGTPPPDWQLNARAALDHAVAAYLNGNARAQAAELERARREIARTGRPELAARAELAYCAARVASLDFEPCSAFDSLRPDAANTELAYADYLYADVQGQAVALLPPTQRAMARAPQEQLALQRTLADINDPLSRLVAAGVLLRSGRANPAVIATAVETASAQGWRRPLLTWLRAQLALAEQAGATAEIERLKRRIALLSGA